MQPYKHDRTLPGTARLHLKLQTQKQSVLDRVERQAFTGMLDLKKQSELWVMWRLITCNQSNQCYGSTHNMTRAVDGNGLVYNKAKETGGYSTQKSGDDGNTLFRWGMTRCETTGVLVAGSLIRGKKKCWLILIILQQEERAMPHYAIRPACSILVCCGSNRSSR